MKYVLSHKTHRVLSMDIDEGTGAIIGLGELYAPERLPVGIPHSGSTVDRHFNNFGVVRNADTLEWLGAAPIYDCGITMNRKDK